MPGATRSKLPGVAKTAEMVALADRPLRLQWRTAGLQSDRRDMIGAACPVPTLEG